MQKIFSITLLFLLLTRESAGQEHQFSFTNLGERDGLKNNIIFSFLKDSHGLLWIGTQNGLNRFDGSHFYLYKKRRGDNSLPHNTINSLCEDKNGDIWGGTGNGVFYYSPLQHKFVTYNAPPGSKNNIITNILCDVQGNIFATTTLDLIKFNQEKKVFELLQTFTSNNDSTGWYMVGKNRMLKDEPSNSLWFGTGIGLLSYDCNTHKFSGFFNKPHEPLFARRSATALAKSPKGYFWFCDNTAKEIIAFDPATKKLLKKISIEKEAPRVVGSTILEDSQGQLWLSSFSYDLLTIDLRNNNKIERLESTEGNSNTVASNFFWAAREDENGTIWLGTPNGISKSNHGKSIYKARQLPEKIPELKSRVIYILEENPDDKTWWIVTADLLIIHYFPAIEKYELYHLNKSVPDKKGLRPKDIIQLRFIDKAIIIMSDEGAWQLNTASKTFVPFSILPKEYEVLIIRDILLADSVFYITDGIRMLSWNKKLNKASWIQNKNDGAAINQPNEFRHLLWKPGNPLFWVSNSSHIALMGKNNQPDFIKLIKNDSVEAGGYFQSADLDNDGNIWVANKGVGLYRYSPRTKEIKYWTDLDGLTDNHLHKIKTDGKGYIWALYYNKVSVFNPAKKSFINFNIPYSENNLNYYNWLTKRADGTIMGTIANEVFEFNNENLNIIPVKKTPELSVVTISGKDYFPDKESKIVLSPDENSFRFKFGLLIDGALYPHDFMYKLQGSDKDWLQSSISNEAVYNNLAPGTYTFRLVAKGKNNNWESAEKSFAIYIKSPFYKTKWFLALLVILVSGTVYLFYRYRLSQKEKVLQLENKAQLLEKEKVMVMYENLKQQLNPHFLFNSLTSLSGLIETDQQVAGNFLEQMSGIYRYILKNGDNETVFLKDEIEFVQLYINLQQTRFKNGLQVNMNVPDEWLHYKIAPVTLQNLIENAIKHNIIDAASPLVIDIFIEGDYLVVKNNLQKKNVVETSNKKGLAQFASLYHYLSELPVLIEETGKAFQIKIPLI